LMQLRARLRAAVHSTWYRDPTRALGLNSRSKNFEVWPPAPAPPATAACTVGAALAAALG
jgi:hypothetical protein